VPLLFDEIRYAIRLLVRQPAFALTALLVLAVGIGFNSAVFSLVYAVLLRPLPYFQPENVYFVWTKTPALKKDRDPWAALDYFELRDRSKSFAGVAASRLYTTTLTGQGEAERVRMQLITANYLPLLGQQPMMGRHLLPEENQMGRGNVVLLTEGYWETRFGRDPKIIGKQLVLDKEAHTVVGVMPTQPGNYWTPDLYAALIVPPVEMTTKRFKTMDVIVRLRDGVTRQQAESELKVLGAQFQITGTDERRKWQPYLQPVHEYVVGKSRQPLLMLSFAVGMVLLIACANLANLLLVRATGRIRELAVRIAMGAGRWRVLRQMAVESIVLGLLGGLMGLVVAYWSIRVITSLEFDGIRRLDQASLNWPVIAFTILVSVGSSLLFGLAPGWLMLRMNLASVLKDEGRGSSGGSVRARGRAMLVMSEVALSVVLLVAAGLLVRTFHELGKVDMGYDAGSVVMARVLAPPARYPEDADRQSYATRALYQLRAIPGVRSASYATITPLMGLAWRAEMHLAGRQAEAGQGETVFYVAAGPGYFSTIGARLKAGRAFTEADRKDSEPVVMISEELEKRYFPDGNAVGQMLHATMMKDEIHARIVGVVHEIRYLNPDDPPQPVLYQPHMQKVWHFFTFVVKTDSNPQALIPAMTRAFSQVDPELPVGNVEPMQALADRLYANRRLTLNLLLVFSLLAIALAAFGLYGVLAMAVTQRAREIGVRMALGASSGDVARLVVRQGMLMAGLGAAIGFAVAPPAARALSDLLYEVRPLDPITYASVAGIVAFTALLACLLPALRAAGVDPAAALRKD
jgi:putative ABC transport system permease protein